MYLHCKYNNILNIEKDFFLMKWSLSFIQLLVQTPN